MLQMKRALYLLEPHGQIDRQTFFFLELLPELKNNKFSNFLSQSDTVSVIKSKLHPPCNLNGGNAIISTVQLCKSLQRAVK